MQQAPAVRACLAADGLALGRSIDTASLAFTAIAFAAALWLDTSLAVRVLLISAVMAGLAQKVFALRVAFDRAIFCDWAQRWEKLDSVSSANDLAAFDSALADVGVRRPGARGERPLDERIHGAMKLLTYQAGLFIIQSLTLLAAIICRHGS